VSASTLRARSPPTSTSSCVRRPEHPGSRENGCLGTASLPLHPRRLGLPTAASSPLKAPGRRRTDPRSRTPCCVPPSLCLALGVATATPPPYLLISGLHRACLAVSLPDSGGRIELGIRRSRQLDPARFTQETDPGRLGLGPNLHSVIRRPNLPSPVLLCGFEDFLCFMILQKYLEKLQN
jgi:hypothetical protein